MPINHSQERGHATHGGFTPYGSIRNLVRQRISASFTARIPIIMDEDGCPEEEQPFPLPSTKLLQKLVTLWEHSIHDWAQILGRGPDGRPYFLDDNKLQWANPTTRTPLPHTLLAALAYLLALLASTDPTHCDNLKRSINTIQLWDLPIAPRWRLILNEDWTTIPETPSPLTLDRATRQHSIKSALTRHPRDPTKGKAVPTSKITLHFSSPRRRKVDRRKADLKRKARATTEPLRGSDGNGDNAGINLVLERCTPVASNTTRIPLLWKNSLSDGTQRTAPSKRPKHNKHKALSSPILPALTQESPHPSYKPPRPPNSPEADPKPRSASRQIPSADCNLHPRHKVRYIFAPSGEEMQP